LQYAAHLPNTRSLLVPVLALTIGAAGATATYAVLDDTDVAQEPTRVIVTETTPPSDGVAAKDEARTAAAVAAPAVATPSAGAAAKNEAGTAAAIATPEQSPSEAAQEAIRTDPQGFKHSLPRASPQP
jgi:hypothetical protein